jgi:hypothetical protein
MVIGFYRCLVAMVAVMGDVFALAYNFHVPLYFEGQSDRTHGWLYVTIISRFLSSSCWSVGYFLFCGFSFPLIFYSDQVQGVSV